MSNHSKISSRKKPKDFQMASGPLIRGSPHSSQEEEDDDDEHHQQVSSFICSSNNNSKSKYSSRNPYSARGLEKFSALLADLEEKRRMIYSQIGSQDIFVRFVYSSGSNVVKPIVVKLTNNNSDVQQKDQGQPRSDDTTDMLDGPDRNSTRAEESSGKETMQQKSLLKKLSWNNNGGVKRFEPVWSRIRSGFRKFLRNPSSYYMLAALILVVLLLAILGRTVAVVCGCVGWYVLPTIRVGSKSMRVTKNQKTYLRKLGENKKVANEDLLL